jgi:hypothetical protein
MPAGEIAAGLLRLFAWFFVEVVLEVLVKGAGYLICRLFNKQVNPDGFPVIFTGLFFWGLIGCLGYVGYLFVVQQIAIDSCLDFGGAFNYGDDVCESQ